jgi:aspartate/methionine/tyrosine aminotransferase
LRALARARGLAIVSDEVFADSAAAPGPTPPSALAGAEEGPLHVVLSGVSKLLALPQCKLAWLAVAGPPAVRDDALARLEFVADAYLSVSPLLARALPALLGARSAIAAELRARLAANRAALARALAEVPAAALLPAEAGWAAIVRYARSGRALAEDELVLALLDEQGVLVQPGFLFDLEPPAGAPEGGHLVLSLLAAPDRFAAGADALARGLTVGSGR